MNIQNHEAIDSVKTAREIAGKYTKELDEIIKEIDEISRDTKDSTLDDVPSGLIEFYCVRIPVLMYYIGQKSEELGLMADIAGENRKSAANRALLETQGTMQIRKAAAEEASREEALAEAVYKRACSMLKTKLDMADKVYSGLKKSLTMRMSEADLAKREN